MSRGDPFQHWQARLASVRGLTSADAALTEVAREVGPLLVSGAQLPREWAPTGIRVEMRPLATSGLCVRGTRRVIVRRRDPLARRRYTVAHELAHLLLTCADDGRGLLLTPRQEESMCERFASQVLIPRELLRDHVESRPPEPSLGWLRHVADHFRASLSATVIALREIDLSCNSAFLIARHSGHPKRPLEVGLRIAHAAAPGWLWLPTHQRLKSLGWRDLVAWEPDQEPGTVREERDACITLAPGGGAPPMTAAYAGAPVSEAQILSGSYRLAMALDVGQLERVRRIPRRQARFQVQEDQLALSV
jgi:IrrE N-terminal-like domain